MIEEVLNCDAMADRESDAQGLRERVIDYGDAALLLRRLDRAWLLQFRAIRLPAQIVDIVVFLLTWLGFQRRGFGWKLGH